MLYQIGFKSLFIHLESMSIHRRTFVKGLLGAGAAVTCGIIGADNFGAQFLDSTIDCHPSISLPTSLSRLNPLPPANPPRPAKGMIPEPDAFKLEIKPFKKTNVKKILYDYLWYKSAQTPDGRTDSPWDEGYLYTPTMGEYDSRDPRVIDKDINDAYISNSILCFSWSGPASYTDTSLRNYVLKSNHLVENKVPFFILFETDAIFGSGGCGVDLKSGEKILYSCFDYLDDLFNHPLYFKLKGPVVLFYNTTRVGADAAADVIGNLRKRTFQKYGYTPFLIGDFHFDLSLTEGREKLIRQFDGITSYCPYKDSILPESNGFEEKVFENSKPYSFFAKKNGILFVSRTMPGYEEPEKQRIPRSIGRHKKSIEYGLMLTDEDNPMLAEVKNEWHEGAQIDAAIEYGPSYRDLFGSV